MRNAFSCYTFHVDTPIVIRNASIVDIDFIVEIEELSFSSPWTKETILEEINQKPWSQVDVAISNDILVGFIVYWIVAEEIHLLNIAVHPSFRYKGIASAMINSLIQTAHKKKVEEILLEVRVSNRNAQTLYRKFGFKPLGIRKKYYSDNGEDAVVMCLRREP